MKGKVKISYSMNMNEGISPVSGRKYIASLEWGEGDNSRYLYADSMKGFMDARATVLNMFQALPDEEVIDVS